MKFGTVDGFDVGSSRAAGIAHNSCFFDSCVASQEALVSVLNNRFEGLFEDVNMRIENLGEGKQTVIDDACGCAFPHDFSANRGIVLTRQNVLEALPKVREKYAYLRSNTIDQMSSGQSKLYVLYGNLLTPALAGIFCSIDQYNDNYHILLAAPEAGQQHQLLPPQHAERLIQRQVTHQPYPGHIASWAEALRGIELSDAS